MLRIFIVIIFIFNLSGCGYNDIQTYDEQVNASWSEVLNQYQRCADLIPKSSPALKVIPAMNEMYWKPYIGPVKESRQ